MLSPNHKSAPDAIHATAQKSENCSKHDGRNEAVQAIH